MSSYGAAMLEFRILGPLEVVGSGIWGASGGNAASVVLRRAQSTVAERGSRQMTTSPLPLVRLCRGSVAVALVGEFFAITLC